MAAARPGGPSLIILFDGVCSLCDGLVKFVMRRDVGAGAPRFRFAALQSRAAAPLLARHGVAPNEALASFVLVDEASGEAFRRSDAALRIAGALPQPWPLLGLLGSCVPRLLRDAVYDCVARNRYAVFGTRELHSGGGRAKGAGAGEGEGEDEDEAAEGAGEGEGCLLPTKATLARFLDADEILEKARVDARAARERRALARRGGAVAAAAAAAAAAAVASSSKKGE